MLGKLAILASGEIWLRSNNGSGELPLMTMTDAEGRNEGLERSELGIEFPQVSLADIVKPLPLRIE